MKKDKVSSAVIRRLPRYYRHLNDLYLAGVERISSNALGKSMGLTASQIRQDLSCFGGFGQQGYGYNIENLRGEISDILGMNRGHNAVILGAGNLGRALMENFHFERSVWRFRPPLMWRRMWLGRDSPGCRSTTWISWRSIWASIRPASGC